MKTLLTSLILITTFTPYITCMNQEATFAEADPYDLKKMILLELSQNIHKYVSKENEKYAALEASWIIRNVSRVNWNLYNELDKQRNDPVTNRIMINNLIKILNAYSADTIMENMQTLGAKKCIHASNELYRWFSISPEKIEELFKAGAVFDYYGADHNGNHWVSREHILSHCKNNIPAFNKLLELGANPNKGNIMYNTIRTQNAEQIATVLKYKPTDKNWSAFLQRHNERHITGYKFKNTLDVLIAHSSPNDLNDGLIACVKNKQYVPEIMQQLIDNGANPNIALPHALKSIHNSYGPINTDTNFIQNVNFLCDQKAFDQTTLIQLQEIIKIFNSLVDKLKNNQSLQ